MEVVDGTLDRPVWRPRLPAHMKGRVPHGPTLRTVRDALGRSSFATVCEQALCPNRTDCWARGSVAFQILGSVCTRRCAFCAETTGRPGDLDASEPQRLVEAARRMALRHVVITSPARDDLDDQGAEMFAACVRALREGLPAVSVEVLTPDFQGRDECLDIVFQARPDIFNHNLETVPRLTPRVRARATYDRSLSVLARSARLGLFTKSGLMVGLGEKREELSRAFVDLAAVGVRSVTVGQYLPPSADHWPVDRYYSLEEFADVRQEAQSLFDHALVAPRVRSSYHADEWVAS